MKFYHSGSCDYVYRCMKLGYIKRAMPSFYYKGSLDKVSGTNIEVIVDSGAYTIQELGKMSNLDDYVKKYIQAIQKYRFDYWVELDIDSATSVPTAKVDEIYNELSKYGKIIRVWHQNRGIDTWYEYLDKYDYIGLSGIEKLNVNLMSKLVFDAYQKGVRVHGFGCASVDKNKRIPFYSVDSSLMFLQMCKFGMITVFNKTTGEFEKRKYNGLHEGDKIDYKLLHACLKERKTINSKTKHLFDEIAKTALKTYDDYEEFITKYWQRKGVDWDAKLKERKQK